MLKNKSTKLDEINTEHIVPEKDDGNIEYKLKLIENDSYKIEQWLSQMSYRIQEGGGECIYNIGVTDTGGLIGLTESEHKTTMTILEKIADKNNYIVSLLSEKIIKNTNPERKVYEYLIRENNPKKYIDLKIAIAGNVDSGKCLAKNTLVKLYNGRIKAVQDLTINDTLLGDDCTPRKILKFTEGFGEMYKISFEDGGYLTINKNHILCLKATKNYTSYLKKGDIVQIPLYQYINESNDFRDIFKPYKVPVEYEEKIINCNLNLISCIEQKYIPEQFKFNSRIIRLQTLAELEKMDFCKVNKNILDFYINYKDQGFIADILDLVRSIGYSTRIKHFINSDIIQINVIKELNLIMNIKTIEVVKEQKYYGFVLNKNQRYLHVDYMVGHNSSTLGSLMTGQLDNGRGSSRLNVFNFQHEVKTGRTSSVGHHIIGFDTLGNVIRTNSDFGRKLWSEIIRDSCKVVTFFDLCGHEKYLKTTIMGLTSMFPDLCIITVGANMGVTKMTREHLYLCMTLKIPFIVVVTKIDICKNRQNILKDTLKSIKELITGVFRRTIYKIKTDDDIILMIKNFHSRNIVPILHVSNVTGQGLSFLTKFINLVPRKPREISEIVSENNVEFHVESMYSISGVGTVVGGQLISGTINVGDKLFLGPINNNYIDAQVKSIHVKRVPVQTVEFGCYVCLALKKIDRKIIRRGQVILSSNMDKLAVIEFTANITVIKSHSTTIKVGYEPVVHCCSIRQSAKIISIMDKKTRKANDNEQILRSNDRAIVKFRFSYKSEYIKPGMRLLLAEGNLKVVGEVKEIF